MNSSASPAEAARRDLWTALILLAATAIGFVSMARNAETLFADFGADPGPAIVPELLLGLLGLLALWLGAAATVRLVRAGAWPVAPLRRQQLRPFVMPLLMIASLLAYVYVMPRVGFIPATLAFALLWLLLIGIQEEGRPTVRRAALYVAETIVIVAVIYIVFARLILVVLP